MGLCGQYLRVLPFLFAYNRYICLNRKQPMIITEKTTAAEIAALSSDVSEKQLEHAIKLYAMYRHKQDRHEACEIVTQMIHSEEIVSFNDNVTEIQVEETRLIRTLNQPSLTARIINIRFED